VENSTEVKVESVKAINANLVQVTLTEDAPALKAENVKISNGVTVNKVTVAGNKVTIETSTLPANKDLTVTFEGVASLDKASGAFKYNQAVNLETAIEGFVYVPKLDAKGKKVGTEVVPAIDVTVTAADGTTTKTDANGYYKLPAQVGTVEVTIKANGHYVSEEDIVVAAKNSTAHVVTLELVNPDEFKIEGTVKDSKTGKEVKGATVELQAKVGSDWKTVAKAAPDTDGNYAFLNKEAELSTDPEFTDEEAVKFTDIFGERTNKIQQGVEYRVVAEKDTAVVAEEAAKPYHKATVAFKLNEKNARTFEPVAMDAVKEIKKIDVDFNYGAVFSAIEDLGKAATLTLIDADGETVLAATEDAVDLALEKDAETATHASKVNLVEKLAADKKMYLKTGTYYLKVDDTHEASADTPGTAVEIIPVKVTEGTDATAKYVAKKAESATVTSQFNYIPEGLTDPDPAIAADVKVYKTINGVDVLVEEAFSGRTEEPKASENLVVINGGTATTGELAYTLKDGKLTGELALSRLAAEGYKVVVDDKYILGNPSTNVKLESGKTVQGNLAVDGGGVLEVTTELVKNDASNTAMDADGLAGNIIYTNVTLTDDKGAKVEYKDIPLVFQSATSVKGKLNVEETNKLLKKLNLSVAQDDSATHKLTFTFAKLKEGKYTAAFASDEFKNIEAKEDKVVMFDEAKANEKVDLVMTPDIELEGAITFAGTKENAKVAAVKVFKLEGENEVELTGDKLDATNLSTTAGSYKLTLPKAQNGKYKVVFYGQDPAQKAITAKESQFETVEKVFDLKKGENFEHVEVVKGGQGKIELNVFDTNGVRLDDGDVTITFADAYTDLPGIALGTIADGYTESKVNLSKGDYKVLITSQDKEKHADLLTTVTIDRINGTTLQTIEVPVVNNGKTFEVSGFVYDNEATVVKGARVAIFNATTGEFVRTVTTATTTGNNLTEGQFKTKLSNGSYVVKTYVDGNFVSQKEIEVKDRKVDNVDMTTKEAKR